jgi:hypothetical protein
VFSIAAVVLAMLVGGAPSRADFSQIVFGGY